MIKAMYNEWKSLNRKQRIEEVIAAASVIAVMGLTWLAICIFG